MLAANLVFPVKQAILAVSKEQSRTTMNNRIRNVCDYFQLITLFILLFIPSSFLDDDGRIQQPKVTRPENYTSFVNSPKIWNYYPIYNTVRQIPTYTAQQPFLVTGKFVCGLHCIDSENKYCLFAVSIFTDAKLATDLTVDITKTQVVWSSNRNNPADGQAHVVVEFTSEGELKLKDAKDTLLWSTGTTGKSVSSLNLSAEGNLMLLDKTNHVVWQSFDHPTDSLLLGQRLVSGQKLRASVSPQNSSEGLYAFGITNDGRFASYMDSQIYYKRINREDYNYSGQYYAEFRTGRFGRLDVADSAMFIQLGSDGHLKAYDWNSEHSNWNGTDILGIDRCSYPSACGKYGVCLEEGCSCPDDVVNKSETAYFKPTKSTNIDLGCYEILPISCELSHNHSFLQLPGEYFQGVYNFVFSHTMKVEDCKEACLNNCSCKAVLYRKGYCQFLSEVLSIEKIDFGYSESGYTNSAFIKVRDSQSPSKNISSSNFPRTKRQNTIVIVGSALGSIIGVFLICIFIFQRFRKRFQGVEEDYLDNMLGMPTRFSYEELKNATNNFSNKLGEGGFGSVFHGILPSGSEVAVKHLVGFGPVNKSFLAEVQTIGSIHHRSLVTLVGFCAEKLERLLVYECMANGSLDRWIFNKNHDSSLGWQIRKKIILDIAKGLAYLHEECNQKIIHLDIKPQNILLDENFNAKVSDFGLSKLIGKDQSHVFTGMRGSPGYMAPEWLSSVITEKADVYSFGIVILEIMCGRRNFDASQNEEDRHLVGVFRREEEEGRVVELIDKFSEDMQSNAAEVVEMMKVAAWCLQTEYTRRPSMSTVVKLFEGSVDDSGNMNGNLLNGLSTPEAMERSGSTILPSMLSGPR